MTFMRPGWVLFFTIFVFGFLYGCEEKKEQEPTKEKSQITKSNIPEGQVIARVNGQEITIHELNNELSRVSITVENKEQMTRNILKSLVTRAIFTQKAQEMGLDRSPSVMQSLERSRSTILAGAYIKEKMAIMPDVTRTEANQYVLDNANRFSDRQHYIFDSLIVPNDYLTEDRRNAWEKIEDLNVIESVLIGDGVNYKRLPFNGYTEELPGPIRSNIGDLKGQKDVFFMVLKNHTYVSLFKESRPASLTGEEAIKMAKKYLRNEKSKEYLIALEGEALDTAIIEYASGYHEPVGDVLAAPTGGPIKADEGQSAQPPQIQKNSPEAEKEADQK